MLLERAVALLAECPVQLEHTRALVDLAERLGMRPLARRAREELQATGARPRRAALTGPYALTAAEHRVARFAADGHSNRESAEQLYVTQRTVETHLTHAFRKQALSLLAKDMSDRRSEPFTGRSTPLSPCARRSLVRQQNQPATIVAAG